LPIPYNLSHPFPGYYSFQTDHGLIYSIYCIDATESFGLDESFGHTVFHFGLYLENPPLKIPVDVRVEITVVDFVANQLSNNKNCVIYAGSPEGNKEKLRMRLFEFWYSRCKHKFENIERHYRTTSKNNQAAMLIRKDCEHKAIIIDLFKS
jgi:hypothetical protein